MQNNNKKASILIWSIFLSMIIIITFVNISTKVNQNLKNNDEYISLNNINNKIEEIVKQGKINGFYVDRFLENKDRLIFDTQNRTTIGLKQNESHISKINGNSNIEIKILDGGPIKFKNLSNSGVINGEYSFSASIGDLEIINLSGYSKIEIHSSSFSDYLEQFLGYKVIRKVGNRDVIIKSSKIKNF